MSTSMMSGGFARAASSAADAVVGDADVMASSSRIISRLSAASGLSSTIRTRAAASRARRLRARRCGARAASDLERQRRQPTTNSAAAPEPGDSAPRPFRRAARRCGAPASGRSRVRPARGRASGRPARTGRRCAAAARGAMPDAVVAHPNHHALAVALGRQRRWRRPARCTWPRCASRLAIDLLETRRVGLDDTIGAAAASSVSAWPRSSMSERAPSDGSLHDALRAPPARWRSATAPA